MLSTATTCGWPVGEEVEAAGLVAGSASPIGLENIKRVADESIKSGSNFAVGANRPDTHVTNANYPRDFQVDILTDIALAERRGMAASGAGDSSGSYSWR